jgi:Mg2+-importing ATPase
MDILCTDKTGTLTEAHIRLERHLDAEGRDQRARAGAGVPQQPLPDRAAEPLDDADPRRTRSWTFRGLDEARRDPVRLRTPAGLGLVRRGDGPPLLVVKGAFEDILRLSSLCAFDAGDVPAHREDVRKQLIARCRGAQDREGFRVLGIRVQAAPPGCAGVGKDDEKQLTFAGYAASSGPTKTERARGASQPRRAGQCR